MSIEFKNVTKSFGPQRLILDQISFRAKPGHILFILGRSGMGKSVTLKLIMGLLRADGGQILIDQQDITHFTEEEYLQVRTTCGMVFQHPALFDSMTIYENIAFGLRHWQLERQRARVMECLRLVYLDEDILSKRPVQISYGMQKRVSLARTLAPGPRFILFDEPTTGLDPITTTAINDLITELSRKLQITSVVVSHDMGCALKSADQIIIIDQGKIIVDGSVEQVKRSAHPLIKGFLAEVLTSNAGVKLS